MGTAAMHSPTLHMRELDLSDVVHFLDRRHRGGFAPLGVSRSLLSEATLLGGARPEDISALQWQTRYVLGVPLVMTLVSSVP
jgi:hypothetical protein